MLMFLEILGLWLEWIEDENSLCQSLEDKKEVEKLFKLAVNDYEGK